MSAELQYSSVIRVEAGYQIEYKDYVYSTPYEGFAPITPWL